MREKLKSESEKKTHNKPSKSKRATPSPPPPEPPREEIASLRSSNVVKPAHIIPNPAMDEVDYNTNSLSGFSDTVTTPTNKEEHKSKPIGFTGLKLGSYVHLIKEFFFLIVLMKVLFFNVQVVPALHKQIQPCKKMAGLIKGKECP